VRFAEGENFLPVTFFVEGKLKMTKLDKLHQFYCSDKVSIRQSFDGKENVASIVPK
jgi:hypothetical protein